MTEWQPISTAPKDGTDILGWDNDDECMIINWKWGRWWSSHDCEDRYDPKPTYWMPLPAPPKENE